MRITFNVKAFACCNAVRRLEISPGQTQKTIQTCRTLCVLASWHVSQIAGRGAMPIFICPSGTKRSTKQGNTACSGMWKSVREKCVLLQQFRRYFWNCTICINSAIHVGYTARCPLCSSTHFHGVTFNCVREHWFSHSVMIQTTSPTPAYKICLLCWSP